MAVVDRYRFLIELGTMLLAAALEVGGDASVLFRRVLFAHVKPSYTWTVLAVIVLGSAIIQIGRFS